MGYYSLCKKNKQHSNLTGLSEVGQVPRFIYIYNNQASVNTDFASI